MSLDRSNPRVVLAAGTVAGGNPGGTLTTSQIQLARTSERLALLIDQSNDCPTTHLGNPVAASLSMSVEWSPDGTSWYQGDSTDSVTLPVTKNGANLTSTLLTVKGSFYRLVFGAQSYDNNTSVSVSCTFTITVTEFDPTAGK